MNIYQKLQEARVKLNESGIKKTGHNKFSNYDYYELEDFIPQAMKLFSQVGLCSIVSYTENRGATLTIVNIDEPAEQIIITSSPATCDLKGMHDIQNLGAIETYQRRYLYITALEITEKDTVDSSEKRTDPGKKNDKKDPLFPEPKPMTDDQFMDLLAIQDSVLLAEKMDKAKADGINANPGQLKVLRAKYKELEEMNK